MWLALIKHKHMDFHDLQSTQQAMNRYIGETNALDTNDKHKKTIKKKKKKKTNKKKQKTKYFITKEQHVQIPSPVWNTM